MADQRIDGTLTAEQLRTVLDYDPDTGIFRWRYRSDRAQNWNSRRAGKPAGGLDGQFGYITIRIDYQLFQAHRLAWLYMTGEWPSHMVDHRDANPGNNAWENLRAADRSRNMMNQRKPPKNTSGFKGVSRVRGTNKWCAQIGANGKNHYLGIFTTPEAAHIAYCEAAKRLHGEFARFD